MSCVTFFPCVVIVRGLHSLFEISTGKLASSELATSALTPPEVTNASSKKLGTLIAMTGNLAHRTISAKVQSLKNAVSLHEIAAVDDKAPKGASGGNKRSSVDSTLMDRDMKRVLEATQAVSTPDGQGHVVATYLETVPRHWVPKIHSYEVSEESKQRGVEDPLGAWQQAQAGPGCVDRVLLSQTPRPRSWL